MYINTYVYIYTHIHALICAPIYIFVCVCGGHLDFAYGYEVDEETSLEKFYSWYDQLVDLSYYELSFPSGSLCQQAICLFFILYLYDHKYKYFLKNMLIHICTHVITCIYIHVCIHSYIKILYKYIPTDIYICFVHLLN